MPSQKQVATHSEKPMLDTESSRVGFKFSFAGITVPSILPLLRQVRFYCRILIKTLIPPNITNCAVKYSDDAAIDHCCVGDGAAKIFPLSADGIMIHTWRVRGPR